MEKPQAKEVSVATRSTASDDEAADANEFEQRAFTGSFVNPAVEDGYKVFVNRQMAAITVSFALGSIALGVNEFLLNDTLHEGVTLTIVAINIIGVFVVALLHCAFCTWNRFALPPGSLAKLHEYLVIAAMLLINLDALLAESYSWRCVGIMKRRDGLSHGEAVTRCVRRYHATVILYMIAYSACYRLRPAVACTGVLTALIMYCCGPLLQHNGVEAAGGDVFAMKVAFVVLFAIISIGTSLLIDSIDRKRYLVYVESQRAATEAARSVAELTKSLKAFLPDDVAPRLTEGLAVLDRCESATVAVCEVYQFVQWSNLVLPRKAVELVNRLVSCLDDRVHRLHLKRFKVLGDRYICGSPIRAPPTELATLTKRVLKFVTTAFEACEEVNSTSNVGRMEVQLGIHTAPAFATVIGTRSVNYEVFGPAVAHAIQMCQQAGELSAAVSDATWSAAGQVWEDVELPQDTTTNDDTEAMPTARVLPASDLFRLLKIHSAMPRFQSLGADLVVGERQPLRLTSPTGSSGADHPFTVRLNFTTSGAGETAAAAMRMKSITPSESPVPTSVEEVKRESDARVSWLEDRLKHVNDPQSGQSLGTPRNAPKRLRVRSAKLADAFFAADCDSNDGDEEASTVISKLRMVMRARHPWRLTFVNIHVEEAYQETIRGESNKMGAYAMLYLTYCLGAVDAAMLIEFLVTPFRNKDFQFRRVGYIISIFAPLLALSRAHYLGMASKPLPAIECFAALVPVYVATAGLVLLGTSALTNQSTQSFFLFILFPYVILLSYRFHWYLSILGMIVGAIIPFFILVGTARNFNAFNIFITPAITILAVVATLNQEKVEREKFVDVTLGELEVQAAERNHRLHRCLLQMVFPLDLVETAIRVHRTPSQMYVKSAEDAVVLTLRLDSFSESMAMMAGRSVDEAVNYAESIAAKVESATSRCPNMYRIGGLGDVLFLVGMFNVSSSNGNGERLQREAIADMVQVMAGLRQSSLNASGTATVGPVTTTIVGRGVPTFNVLGPAIRRCQGLAGQAPNGYFGADELFLRAASSIEGLKNSFETSSVSWKVRGIGVVRMAALSAGEGSLVLTSTTSSRMSSSQSSQNNGDTH